MLTDHLICWFCIVNIYLFWLAFLTDTHIYALSFKLFNHPTRYYYLHLADEKPEAEKGYITCPGSQLVIDGVSVSTQAKGS